MRSYLPLSCVGFFIFFKKILVHLTKIKSPLTYELYCLYKKIIVFKNIRGRVGGKVK